MSLNIYRTDGSLLTTIPDGVVNTISTPLSLPGRNYSSYGVVMDTNFVHQLENFANTSVPSNPIRGQLWYNTTNGSLYVCPTDGETNPSNWIKLLTVSDTDLNADNLSLSGNLDATNANISNTLNANHVTANYLTVNVSANIANAKLTGSSNIANILTGNITTGTSATAGNITGNWTLTGNLNVPSGNIVSSNIRSDGYKWANGTTINFEAAAGSQNQVQYNNAGNLAGSAALVFDSVANSLTVGGNLNASNIFATSGFFGGNASGLTNIPGANVTGTLDGSVQSNITQLGTLTSLLVTDIINAGNLAVSGNITGAKLAGTLTTHTQPNITTVGTLLSLSVSGDVTSGNIAAGNLVSANYLTGTLTTASQPNITSVGTLTSLGVSGNITAPNIIANTGVFYGNGSGLTSLTGANVTGKVANAIYADYAGASGPSTTAITVTGNAQPNVTSVGTLTSLSVTGNIAAGNVSATKLTGTLTTAAQPNITSVGVLSSVIVSGNINSGNVISKFYGDGSGLSALTGSNVTGTVANATYATSAGSATTATTAVTVTAPAQPNITSLGTLTSLTATGNISGANINGKHYGNGAGLTDINGSNVTSAVATAINATTAGTVTTNAQPNITSVGTLSSLTVSGNITGANLNGNHFGNGAGLTNLQSGSITGKVANAIYADYAGASGPSDTAVTVTASAQPNITSVGILNSLSVSGAVSAASVSGSILIGTLATNAQPNITSVGTLTSLGVSGNITGANINGKYYGNAAGLSNVPGPNVTGKVANAIYADYAGSSGPADTAVTVTGNSQPNITGVGTLSSLTVSGAVNAASVSGSTITGTLTTAAQLNITSVGTLTSLGVSGNITAPNIIANTGVFYGNGSGLTSVTGANVAGSVANATYATNAGSATSATTASTVTTAAQPNITSVGTLTSLSVNGTITASNVAVNTGTFSGNAAGLTNVPGANVTGKVANAVYADVAGASGPSTTAITVTGNAQPNITSVGTLTSLSVNGTITASNVAVNTGTFSGNAAGLTNVPGANVTGTVANATYATSAGSASTAGTVTTNAQPNITSVGTLTSLTTSGNVGIGNSSPQSKLDVYNSSGYTDIRVRSGSTQAFMAADTSAITMGTYNNVPMLLSVNNTERMRIDTAGNVGIGTSSPSYKLDVTGDIRTTGVMYGNGSGLSAIAGVNVTGTVANATYAINAGTASIAGTVTTAAQPNITSVGTLTSLGVNGNIIASNIIANTGVFYGNGSGLTSINGSNVIGNVSNSTNSTKVFVADTANGTNNRLLFHPGTVGTYSNVYSAANIYCVPSTGALYVNYISGDASGLYNIPGSQITGPVNSSTTAATVTTNAQPNITSVGTLTSLNVSGNITGANVNGNHFGNGSGLSQLTGANVTGKVANAVYSDFSGSAGTVTTLNYTQIINGLGYTPYNSTNPNQYVPLSSFTQSFSGTGWTILPNGFIIQWGTVPTTYGETTSTSYFPITFPSQCVSAVGTVYNSSGDNENDFWYQIYQMSTTSVTWFHNSSDGGSQPSGGWYIAIGF